MRRNTLTCLLLVATAGCNSDHANAPRESSPAPAPTQAVELTVLVIDDSPLADGVKLLRGEWSEHSGSEVRVVEAGAEAVTGDELPQADLIVFPPRQLGELVERQWLRPMRDSALTSDEFDLEDVLPLIRLREMVYAGRVYVLPLYSQTPLVSLTRKPQTSDAGEAPITWRRFAAAEGAAEPTDSPWTAALLIARAGCYSDNDLRETLLFSVDDMAPRLTEPTFQRALSEVAQIHAGGLGTTNRGPGESTARVLSGAAPAAIGLPPSVEQVERPIDSPPVKTRWDELPRADETYSRSLDQWHAANGDAGAATLLGVGGRAIGVTTSTRNTAAAFRLAAWLAEPHRAGRLASRTAANLPVRRSHLAAPQGWFGAALAPAEKSQVAGAVERALTREQFVQLPRIPGVDEYLDALYKVAVRVVRGETAVEPALEAAAAEWEQITERLGREQQIAAYRRHLGLSE